MYRIIKNYFFFLILLANNIWFERFQQQLITMRNEYLALSSHCLEGGEAATIEFILNRHVINENQTIEILYQKYSLFFSVLFFVQQIQ